MNPYKHLFKSYIADLKVAKNFADAWWDSLLACEEQRLKECGSTDKSLDRLNQRWPFGPSSHPRVVAVYRKYYRACTALTNELDAREEDEIDNNVENENDWGEDDQYEYEYNTITTISTGTFMIEYLCDESDELAEFILNMVFIPIETTDEYTMLADLEQQGNLEPFIRATVDSYKREQR